MRLNVAVAPLLVLFLLAAGCGAGAPAPGSTTTSAAMEIPTTYVSPNVPAGITYPAIASWEMFPLILKPGTVRAGEPVEVWTSIYMVDFLITFVIARLEVNGAQVDKARWMLYIDERDPFNFVYTPPAPGTYKITIVCDLEENEPFYGTSRDMSISYSETLVVT